MKNALAILVLALLAAGDCLAQTGDAESEKRRQEMEARRQAEEARQRAEAERERQPGRGRFYAEPYRIAPQSASELFEQAAALEQQGKGPEAVKLYVRAARAGSGKAALRMAQIYDKGLAGVTRDYAESVKWENAARVLGEDVPTKKP